MRKCSVRRDGSPATARASSSVNGEPLQYLREFVVVPAGVALAWPMADRRKERQGKRRAAANTPKVATPKAAGGAKKAKPASNKAAANQRPATQGKTVAARGNSPPSPDRQPDEAASVDPALPPPPGLTVAAVSAGGGSRAQSLSSPSGIAGVAASGRAGSLGQALPSGIEGVTATGRAAGVETTVIGATPETHTVTVDADFVVKTLASVDVPQDAIMIPGAGNLAANAEVVPARSRGPRRKRARATRRPRQVTKARLLRQTDVAEAALKKLAPPHGGMGHNSQRRAIRWPLTQIQYDLAMAAIRSLRDALATGGRAAIAAMKATGKTLARTATILKRWLEPRVGKFGDEFAKSFGKTAGKSAGNAVVPLATALVGYAFGAHVELGDLLLMIVAVQGIGHRSGRD